MFNKPGTPGSCEGKSSGHFCVWFRCSATSTLSKFNVQEPEWLRLSTDESQLKIPSNNAEIGILWNMFALIVSDMQINCEDFFSENVNEWL